MAGWFRTSIVFLVGSLHATGLCLAAAPTSASNSQHAQHLASNLSSSTPPSPSHPHSANSGVRDGEAESRLRNPLQDFFQFLDSAIPVNADPRDRADLHAPLHALSMFRSLGSQHGPTGGMEFSRSPHRIVVRMSLPNIHHDSFQTKVRMWKLAHSGIGCVCIYIAPRSRGRLCDPFCLFVLFAFTCQDLGGPPHYDRPSFQPLRRTICTLPARYFATTGR